MVALFHPLHNCTSTREPLYSMFVFIDTYELIIEERSVEGIPSLRRAGSMALWGIVSKAFEMSSCINTSPCRDLARRSISLSACMLLKHPGSDTKPFCLWEKFVLALSLWSIIHQYIRHTIGLIVSGLKFSILFGSLPGFVISIVSFSFQFLGCLWVIRRRLKRSLSASLVSLWLMCFFSIPSGPGALPFFILFRRVLISFCVMAQRICCVDSSFILWSFWSNGMAIAGLSTHSAV